VYVLNRHKYENPHKSKLYWIQYPLYVDPSNYALVTFQLITEDFDNDFSIEMPVAIITIIHLPDKHSKNLSVTKLAQYMKFSNDRILNLKVTTKVLFLLRFLPIYNVVLQIILSSHYIHQIR